VAAGGTATIHGKGVINGVSGYTYQFVCVDGKTDSMRLQVWNSDGTLVYDNGSIAPLKAGSITIK
jgi:hypothetical protein